MENNINKTTDNGLSSAVDEITKQELSKFPAISYFMDNIYILYKNLHQ